MQTAHRGLRSLFSPAGVVALLALVISLSGTAYAVATITGADIKNGTVTTRDIKDNNLALRDMNAGVKKTIRDSGARAVAEVWGDTGGCYVTMAASRGVTGECTRSGAGEYIITLAASVKTAHSAPICGFGGNGGFNGTYDWGCDTEVTSATTIRVMTGRHDDTGTGSRAMADTSATVPVVVVLP